MITTHSLASDLMEMKITQADIINLILESNGTPTMASVIKELIALNNNKAMQEGVDYFYSKNDILDRKIYYWKNNVKTEDATSPNNRIPNNYHKILVMQKMGYLVGKPITFSDKESSENDDGKKVSPNEEFVTEINKVLDEEWDDISNELVKGASNKGVEWLHIYIDENGGFGYTVIDARQVIPIWETQRQEQLEGIIRYYTMYVNGKDRIRAEHWTRDDVTYYLQDDSGVFVLEENPQSHFDNIREIDGEQVVTGLSWGVVPFIPFKNNEELSNDLQDYKELIDIYDKVYADGANNIESIQDAIWVLKNYEGTELEEFQDNLRKYKALKVDEKGGADVKTAEIPTEAREKFLDRTEENIYTFGMGVDVSTDKYGQNPSGVALKFLYALLDLKCDVLERKFKKSIRELIWFIAEYYKITQKKNYNHKAIDITFNRTMITNEAEKIDSAQKSKNIIDDETIISNHPWVDDPQKVLEKLEEQKATLTDAFNNRLEQDLDNLEGETGGVEL